MLSHRRGSGLSPLFWTSAPVMRRYGPSILLYPARRDGGRDVQCQPWNENRDCWLGKMPRLLLLALDALRHGAGAVLTGPQVGLLGGAAVYAIQGGYGGSAGTAGERREGPMWRSSGSRGKTTTFEIDQGPTFPSRKELRKLATLQRRGKSGAGGRHCARRADCAVRRDSVGTAGRVGRDGCTG